MTLDPIQFTSGLLIYLEGYPDRIIRKVLRKFRKSSSTFNQTSELDSLLSVVLYYGSKGRGAITTDMVWYKNLSENYDRNQTFAVKAMFENQPHLVFDRVVLSMKPGENITHNFTISKQNVGAILRREYRTVVPNQKARVSVDGKDAGLWYCPQRALTEDFSLRINDYHLPPRLTVGKKSIEVTLKAITQWETISIKMISIVLTDKDNAGKLDWGTNASGYN